MSVTDESYVYDYDCIKECISLMQNSDSFHGFGCAFWAFWVVALHLLYKLWISNILATSITEETCIVEMRIWYKKIGTVNFIMYTKRASSVRNYNPGTFVNYIQIYSCL